MRSIFQNLTHCTQIFQIYLCKSRRYPNFNYSPWLSCPESISAQRSFLQNVCHKSRTLMLQNFGFANYPRFVFIFWNKTWFIRSTNSDIEFVIWVSGFWQKIIWSFIRLGNINFESFNSNLNLKLDTDWGTFGKTWDSISGVYLS